jgi:hypothetical protein
LIHVALYILLPSHVDVAALWVKYDYSVSPTSGPWKPFPRIRATVRRLCTCGCHKFAEDETEEEHAKLERTLTRATEAVIT